MVGGCTSLSGWEAQSASKGFVEGTVILGEAVVIATREHAVYNDGLFSGWREKLSAAGYSDNDIADGSEVTIWTCCYARNGGVPMYPNGLNCRADSKRSRNSGGFSLMPLPEPIHNRGDRLCGPFQCGMNDPVCCCPAFHAAQGNGEFGIDSCRLVLGHIINCIMAGIGLQNARSGLCDER